MCGDPPVIYLLWVGGGPFLDVGRTLIAAFPNEKLAQFHWENICEQYPSYYHYIEPVEFIQ